MSQKFICKGDIVAEGHIKGRFKQRGKGSVPTQKTFKVMGISHKDIPLTHLAHTQIEMEKQLTKPR